MKKNTGTKKKSNKNELSAVRKKTSNNEEAEKKQRKTKKKKKKKEKKRKKRKKKKKKKKKEKKRKKKKKKEKKRKKRKKMPRKGFLKKEQKASIRPPVEKWGSGHPDPDDAHLYQRRGVHLHAKIQKNLETGDGPKHLRRFFANLGYHYVMGEFDPRKSLGEQNRRHDKGSRFVDLLFERPGVGYLIVEVKTGMPGLFDGKMGRARCLTFNEHIKQLHEQLSLWKGGPNGGFSVQTGLLYPDVWRYRAQNLQMPKIASIALGEHGLWLLIDLSKYTPRSNNNNNNNNNSTAERDMQTHGRDPQKQPQKNPQ